MYNKNSIAMTRESPVLDRTIQKLIQKIATLREPPIYELTLEEARNTLVRIQSTPVEQTDVQIENLNVASESGTLRLRVIRPVHVGERSPVILYLHGGGWVLGDATTHDRLVRELAIRSNAIAVFLDYDRAPEHQYPVAIEQAHAAAKFVSEHAEELGIDSARLAVAGESSGGNMAAVVSLLAKQRSGPRIAGQLLFYPATNADFETTSYREFADGPWLTRKAMQWFWDQYLPDRSQRSNPHASPLLAPLDQLVGTPRTLIITAENDVLRDEGEAYGRRLIEAGVEVVSTRYNGVIHDFILLNPIADAAPVRAAMTQAVNFLKSVFTQK
jgi:acetyl esterase